MVMLSVWVPYRPRYYSKVPVSWAQYEAPLWSSVVTTLMLSYYSSFAMRGSSDDKSRVCTIVLIEYIFIARAMFVVVARDGSTPRY